MLPALKNKRPDLVRARAVLEAMRGPQGKQIRTSAQAIAWIDKLKPELTEAWLEWAGKKAGKTQPKPVAGPIPAAVAVRRRPEVQG